MKYKKIMIALAATAALSAAGCGSSSKDTVEVTPTPVPTAAPTSTPGNSQSAADFNTGTEAYWCEDKYREICLSLKQHQG